MAKILNLIIVILELITLSREIKEKRFKKGFVYYTQLSNRLTLTSSILLVIFGQKKYVEIFRFLSVSMLVMTFFVTAFVLVPMSGKVKAFLWTGNGKYHHVIIPILSAVSYLFTEDKAPLRWIWLPILVTLIYGLIIIYLNIKEIIEGPYPFFKIKKIGMKMTVIWMAALLVAVTLFSAAVGYRKSAKTDMKYIFVHGLSGWGSYDLANDFVPYWGLTGGSVTRYLTKQGYESYAASVSPTASAWDRACELYAQLTGTRVDYGETHSKAANHERYGEDFTGRAMVEDFSASRFTLLGHSFGGATIRLFSEILRNGSDEERAAGSSDLSDFFKGGNGDNLFAVVTLAAPTNGTTAYDLYEDDAFDASEIEVPKKYVKNGNLMSKGTKAKEDGRETFDFAAYDMHIDNALALNEKITTFDDVYYLAYPCVSTVTNEDGSVSPNPDITESMFMLRSTHISQYTGVTKGGFTLDASWQPNDGLVNTISAGAPFGAKQAAYNGETILEPGQWYVMPEITGDHMFLQGGMTKRHNVKPFYLELVKLLAEQK